MIACSGSIEEEWVATYRCAKLAGGNDTPSEWTCPVSVPVLPGAVGAGINAVMIRLFLTFLLILQLALSPALAHVPRDPGNMQPAISETGFSVEIPGINLQRWTQQVRDTINLIEAAPGFDGAILLAGHNTWDASHNDRWWCRENDFQVRERKCRD